MKKLINVFTKTTIFSLLLTALLVVPVARVYALAVSGTAVTLIIYAGKVYAVGSKVVGGATGAIKMRLTKQTAEESEKTIGEFLKTIDDNIDKAGHEAFRAKNTDGARDALNKKAHYQDLKLKYQALLNAVKLNKNLTVSNIAKKEIIDQGSGYILGEFGVPDEAQGKGLSNWSLELLLKAGGYEITKKSSEFLGALSNLLKGTWQAGDNVVKGRLWGKNLEMGEPSQEDKDFFQALKDGRITPMKIAITKAQWDILTDVMAKEDFKRYIQGESTDFEKLPLSVQIKYWKPFFALSGSDFERINELMKRARETGNYGTALKEIVEKYADYPKLFDAITRKLKGDDALLAKKIWDDMEKLKQAQEEARQKKEAAKKKKQEKPKTDTSSDEPRFLHRPVTGTGSMGSSSLRATFHSSGGSVTGRVSGKCSGSIRGSFAGGEGGSISGSLSGKCKGPEGESIPASGSFSGSVSLINGRASGSWGGHTEFGSLGGGWHVNFNPIEIMGQEGSGQ